MIESRSFAMWIRSVAGAALVLLAMSSSVALGITEEQEKAKVAKIIGPEVNDNNCASCHALEVEAWQQTKHFSTFKLAHTTDQAKQILKNLGEKSMKRSAECRQCHYTSQLKDGQVVPSWGISCESCHGPGHDWNEIHNRVGDKKLEWGMGKSQSPAEKAARLEAARVKGMIHSDMLYDIATNCFSCHTVPNEKLVNVGKHKAGSDFDLVAWSQGEIRHNFATSHGAPKNPNNRAASPEQLRRMYVVGAMVDLEVSLRNLASVTQKGEAFHLAMIERVNAKRARLAEIVKMADVPEISSVLAQVPEKVDASTVVAPALADALGAAGRQFVLSHDGSKLASLDPKIPTDRKGVVYKP